jgi:Holliday junction resolvase RusA-like endonuclease
VIWIGENMNRAGPIAPIPGPVHVSSEVHGGKGWRINRDIDNTLKVQLDFLQRIKLIANDDCRTVKSVSVRYHEPENKKSAAYVILTVWPAGLNVE